MREAAFPPVPGPDRRRGVSAALAVLCLAAFLHGAELAARAASPAAPNQSAPSVPSAPAPSVLAEAGSAQPYGGGVSATAAHSVARALARLAVLEKGAALLENDLAARMGTVEAPAAGAGRTVPPDARMRALASTVFPVSFEDAPEDAASPPRQSVTARILASPRDAARTIRRALQEPDNLELRLDALRRLDEAAAEGRDLLARNAANLNARPAAPLPSSGTGDPPVSADPNDPAGSAASRANGAENPFAGRAETLAKRLDALEAYLEALRDFGHTWRVPEEAAPLLERLSGLDPQNPLLWMGLGEALLLTERPYEALDAIRAAARLPDAPPRVLYLRGVAHLRLHLPANAVKDFSEAVARRPDKAAWWRARGAARLLAGEHDAMCPDFYQACALGDCEGLAEVRKRGLCLESGGN